MAEMAHQVLEEKNLLSMVDQMVATEVKEVLSFSNLNKRHPGFEEKYEVSVELADFAAEIALIQLNSNRDFLADNPQGSNIWDFP